MGVPSMQLLAAKAAGTGGFAPDDIANGAFWLDASDAATITDSSGAVTAWVDKFNSWSFAGDSGFEPTTGATTRNGLNVIDFAGSDYVTHDAGSDAIDLDPFTFFVVAYDSNPSGSRRVASTRNAATASRDFNAGSTILSFTTTTQYDAFSNGVSPAGINRPSATWFTGRTVAGGEGIYVAVDGSAAAETSGSVAVAAQRYLRVGANCSTGAPPAIVTGETFVGSIAEVICYNADLSSGDITAVEDYLTAKWGL